MNTRYYMVIIKDEIKTSEIMSCVYNRDTQKWDVKFNTGKTYSYSYRNVEKLTEPDVLNPNMYRISREGREFFDIRAIYVFRSTSQVDIATGALALSCARNVVIVGDTKQLPNVVTDDIKAKAKANEVSLTSVIISLEIGGTIRLII